MALSVGGVVFHVVAGDIAGMETDAVVNAANNHFWMGGGVAGAIKQAGGAGIEGDAISQGPVPVGQSVVTSGGRLPAHYVIHAAVMGQDLQTSAKAIRDATWSALECADTLEIESIAFPAFGTGVGGFPPPAAARAMLEAVLDFVRARDDLKLKNITFVLFADELTAVFRETLANAVGV